MDALGNPLRFMLTGLSYAWPPPLFAFGEMSTEPSAQLSRRLFF